MSVVLLRYFCCFGLFFATTVLPFRRRTQGSTYRFRPFPTRWRFASRKSIRSEILSPVRIYDPGTPTNVSSSKILAHYAENENFPPPIPRPLLSAASCDLVIGQGRERGLDPRSNFALPRVVQSTPSYELKGRTVVAKKPKTAFKSAQILNGSRVTQHRVR